MRHAHWKRTSGLGVVLLCALALLVGTTPVAGAPGENLDLGLCARDGNTFTLDIDNSYFPLPVGQQWVYSGQEQGTTIGLQVTVLDETERLYTGQRKLDTRVVEELEWEDANGDGVVDADEDLIEISLNYFAQADDGTVCYFGEDVDIYEDGEVVSHEGAWRADAEGNAPGIFMPATPELGMTYQQEVAPGIAMDEATIIRVGRTVTVPAGTFTQTITVRDFNPLDGSRGTKVYAPGVGLIDDDGLELLSY
jgi:hypothetical protein